MNMTLKKKTKKRYVPWGGVGTEGEGTGSIARPSPPIKIAKIRSKQCDEGPEKRSRLA